MKKIKKDITEEFNNKMIEQGSCPDCKTDLFYCQSGMICGQCKSIWMTKKEDSKPFEDLFDEMTDDYFNGGGDKDVYWIKDYMEKSMEIERKRICELIYQMPIEIVGNSAATVDQILKLLKTL